MLLGPGGEPVVGRDAIRAHEQGFLDAFKIEMTITPAETMEHGEKGWGYGAYKAKLTPHEGGAPVELTGKFLNIVQPRKDGTLEIVRHCWNSDQPMPEPPAG